MLVPLSWLRDLVDVDVPAEWLAERLTLAGLEVAAINYLGLPQGVVEGVRWPASDHLVWDRDKVLLGAIREVRAHPNADRLVLAMVDYGGDSLEQCVTGATNLFEFKDTGPLEPPLWAPFAMEGAELWDGHSEKPKRLRLRERALRGIPNRSMVCSEKELGLSDEHEGILLLADDGSFRPGTPLQDVLGDVVFDIELTPNLARCFSILGVAREVAALLDKPLRRPATEVLAEGPPIEGQAAIRIEEPDLNPRFTLALLRDTQVRPSPLWLQQRLRLVGQRPINNIVDVTNYITFELGQPLHAFDYDKLLARADGAQPTITTRHAQPGETLTTLEGARRELEAHDIILLDSAGILSLGGIIGGAETEIDENTRNVLLEAANWNAVNIRRTMQSQKVITDAGVRFSRGVHPAIAADGVRRGIELMRRHGGGRIAAGIVDDYPLPPEPVQVVLTVAEIQRIMGVDFSADEAAAILRRLEFTVNLRGNQLEVTVPEHRLDISSEAVTGQADLIEELARIHGYDRIPDSMVDDELPPLHADLALEHEELLRDLLATLGLRENISHRFSSPEREALLTPGGGPGFHTQPYVELLNPVAPEKRVLRHTLLTQLLDSAAANARWRETQQVFEIGQVYLPQESEELPREPRRLALLMTGRRRLPDWQGDADDGQLDFFDLKGVLDRLLASFNVPGVLWGRGEHASFHPGRSAAIRSQGDLLGHAGELHPIVAQAFDLNDAPVLVAELDLESLLQRSSWRSYPLQALPLTPPVYQDIALVLREEVSAADVESVLRRAGGDLLHDLRLFDVYTGDPVPPGHRSLAFNLVYQTDARTLTDREVAKVHRKIVRAAENQLGATLRA